MAQHACPYRRHCSRPVLTVVTTGGTIDKEYPRSTSGYAFEFGEETAAARLLSGLSLLGYSDYEVVNVCAKDSQEINTADRDSLCTAVRSASGSQIVVTHGTDTLIDSAQYLLQSGAAAGKAVVFTGAMKPERFKDSDASFNFGGAVSATSIIRPGSVAVCMGGRVVDCMKCLRDELGRFVEADQ
mmetsp:Transcript_792/g.1582  ORF Transcript_792/g.1582 Transcript_792/m.1582 type:complete len:185 (+) Transcript_792:15-569(+)